MQIKHAPADLQSMAQDGDAILRSLQNKTLPIVDLMVRESLQNSLDAAIENQEFADVKYTVGKFNSNQLANHFEEIDVKLNTEYNGFHEFIAVSDKNTYGLTGDYKSNDKEVLDASNFHKLVFSIGKNQDKDGAGGSWGLGKTSYFRMGIGLVIYYTRVQTDDGYEERLIGSMIESPKSPNRILQNNARGIAWWGTYSEDGSKIYPITNRENIGDILSIFSIENYKGTETGTTIIVPYINRDTTDLESDALHFPWESKLETEVAMAVQRWYFPRIQNKSYRAKLNNSFLNVRINDEVLFPEVNFEPIFKIYRDLYNSALIGSKVNDSIQVLPIHLGHNALKNQKDPLGYVAFCEMSREELQMTPPNNKASGLAYLGIKDKSLFENNVSKVMAYCRKPGMIVEYSVNGSWVPSEMVQKEDHLLLSIFVPNSEAILHDSFKEKGYGKLETYLRATENSDHAMWADEDKITIIKRIINNCSVTIKNFYRKDEVDGVSSATSSISRKFGALLLPPTSFGKSPRGTKGDVSGRTKNPSNTKGADISIIKTNLISENIVEVEFKAIMKKDSSSLIYLQLLSQDKKIDKKYWNEYIDGKLNFPINITTIEIKKLNNQFYSSQKIEEIKVFGVDRALEGFKVVSTFEKEVEIEGLITLNVLSNQYLPNLAIKSLSNEE